jgi:hypothetical protein
MGGNPGVVLAKMLLVECQPVQVIQEIPTVFRRVNT